MDIRITRKKLRSIVKDSIRTAEAIQLVYVNDKQPGISRLQGKNGFIYKCQGKSIRDRDTLIRIKSLVVPPAWEKVWICADANGHLQATGFDIKHRKQYLYHPHWSALRNQTKFFHLADFGRALPAIRHQLKIDLSLKGLPQEKVLAAIVSIILSTGIRVGNSMYEKLYGSFGLTTLKDSHLKMNGQNLRFSFKGKKGVLQNIDIKSKKLTRIVLACRDIPGKELFQYYDENGKRNPIDSGLVNSYIKKISGENFTAKDFRTWGGSLHALNAFKNLGCCNSQTEAKKKIIEALDIVAKELGNTRAVCKKYYVHPAIIDMYATKDLFHFFNNSNECMMEDDLNLSSEESILLKILDKSGNKIMI